MVLSKNVAYTVRGIMGSLYYYINTYLLYLTYTSLVKTQRSLAVVIVIAFTSYTYSNSYS
jgi:hypothetical protein